MLSIAHLGSGTAGKEWEEKVKKSQSASDIARCYMELESALKWGDAYPETERAFGDTWASRKTRLDSSHERTDSC